MEQSSVINFADKVNPAHTALLVIDVQQDFCSPGGALARLGTDLSMIRLEEARPRLSAFRVASLERRGNLIADIGRLRRGRPLWDYLLFLVLIFLLGETVYGNWVRRES